MEGLDSPLSTAVASILADVAWSFGTYEAPKEDLRLYYSCPTDANPNAAQSIDFTNTNSEELEDLVRKCQPASFGRNLEDVLDPSYRKAGKLDTSQFVASFNLINSGILDALKNEMRIEHDLRAELYKLNVYDKGCFFKTHKDTPRSEDMIASLVIVFPSAHEGGSLLLRHDDKELEFDSGNELSGDTDHEVKEVTSGHRVTLTYNLHVSKSQPMSVRTNHDQQDQELLDAMQKVLDNPDGPKYERFGFGLQHQYAFWQKYKLTSSLFRRLKGSDSSLLRVCNKLGLKCQPYVLYENKDDYGCLEYRLADSVIENGEYYGEDEDMWRNTPNVAELRDLFWVTDPRTTNEVENSVVFHYGNGPGTGYVYGNIVVIAKRG